MTWGMSAAQMDDAALTAGAHRGSPASERSRAVRQLAMLATDAEDARTLLEQLGLAAVEGKRTEQVA